jgi:hypothetical protein
VPAWPQNTPQPAEDGERVYNEVLESFAKQDQVELAGAIRVFFDNFNIQQLARERVPLSGGIRAENLDDLPTSRQKDIVIEIVAAFDNQLGKYFAQQKLEQIWIGADFEDGAGARQRDEF